MAEARPKINGRRSPDGHKFRFRIVAPGGALARRQNHDDLTALETRVLLDLGELGDFYRNYMKLMAHWRDALQVPMLDVDYEQLVQDPEPGVRAILEFCGLEWEESCLKFHKSKRAINTASYQQVRKPIYTRSAGRWKNYEKHLGPLIDALRIDPNEWE